MSILSLNFPIPHPALVHSLFQRRVEIAALKKSLPMEDQDVTEVALRNIQKLTEENNALKATNQRLEGEAVVKAGQLAAQKEKMAKCLGDTKTMLEKTKKFQDEAAKYKAEATKYKDEATKYKAEVAALKDEQEKTVAALKAEHEASEAALKAERDASDVALKVEVEKLRAAASSGGKQDQNQATPCPSSNGDFVEEANLQETPTRGHGEPARIWRHLNNNSSRPGYPPPYAVMPAMMHGVSAGGEMAFPYPYVLVPMAAPQAVAANGQFRFHPPPADQNGRPPLRRPLASALDNAAN